jgi:fluoride exporter
MSEWQKLLWLAGIGAVGTIARYEMQGWVQHFTGAAFPWGTLAVNLLGCFLIGLITMLAEERRLIAPETRLIAAIGFMGAFTTFSTFALETVRFLAERQWLYAFGNLVLQNVLGIVAVFAGFIVGRLF